MMLTHLSGEGVIFRSLASRTGRAWDLGMPSPMGQECLLSAEIWLLQSAGLQLYYAVWASSMQFELHSRSSERYHLSCLAPAENAQHIVHRTFFPQRLARAASHHCHFGQFAEGAFIGLVQGRLRLAHRSLRHSQVLA